MVVRDIILGPPRIALLIVMVIITGQGIRGEGTTAIVAPVRHHPIEIEEIVARSTATVTAGDNLPSREQITKHFSPTETRSGIRSQDVNHPEGLRRFLIRLAARVAEGSRGIFEAGGEAVEDVAEHGEMIAGTADETANQIIETDLTLGTSDLESESESETGATATGTPSPPEVGDRLHKDEAVPLPDEISETREMCHLALTRSERGGDQEMDHYLLVPRIRTPHLGPNPSAVAAFPAADVAEDVVTGTVGVVEEEIIMTIQETGMAAAREVALKRGDGDGMPMIAIAGTPDISIRCAIVEMNGNQEIDKNATSSHGSWIGYLTNRLLQPRMSRRRLSRRRHLPLELFQVDNHHLLISSH